MLTCTWMTADVMARAVLRAVGHSPGRAALVLAVLVGCGSSSSTPPGSASLAGVGGDGTSEASPTSDSTPTSDSESSPNGAGAAPSNTGEPAPTAGTGSGGTAAGGAADPESAAGGSANAALATMTPGVYGGTYFVPVTDDVEAFALFHVDRIRLDVRDGELVLQYDLPAQLLGEARGLSFRGTQSPGGNYVLTGDDGVATCHASGNGWVCDEVLQSVQLDADKIDRMLEALPEAEALARRSVANQFADDPIGVLHIQP